MEESSDGEVTNAKVGHKLSESRKVYTFEGTPGRFEVAPQV